MSACKFVPPPETSTADLYAACQFHPSVALDDFAEHVGVLARRAQGAHGFVGLRYAARSAHMPTPMLKVLNMSRSGMLARLGRITSKMGGVLHGLLFDARASGPEGRAAGHILVEAAAGDVATAPCTATCSISASTGFT